MDTEVDAELARRAAVHRALGDPSRLAIVDALACGDRSPSELADMLAMPSNLLAHHLRVLDRAGVTRRTRSEGDRRRTYLALVAGALDPPVGAATRSGVRVVFVCTRNSARSRLAAALWSDASVLPASSAGTRPATRVHPGAVRAARRHGLALEPASPRHVGDVLRPDDVVVAVCDAAHEELDPDPARLHWAVPDPARYGDDETFDGTVTELAGRITRLATALRPADQGASDGPHPSAS